MLDNGSTTSLANSIASSSGRTKPRRKPVPKYLPDPPPEWPAFPHISYKEQDHPPLPDEWKKNIEKAKHQERFVDRPFSPVPTSPKHSARSETRTTASADVVEKYPAARTEPRPWGDRRQSDAGSTLTASSVSTKLETAASGSPGGSINSRNSSRKSAGPRLDRSLALPPPVMVRGSSRQDGVAVPRRSSAPAAAFRIVYSDPSNSGSHDNLNRNARVFPVFGGSSADVSADRTAVNSVEDLSSTLASRQRTRSDMLLPPSKKQEASVYSYNDKNGATRARQLPVSQDAGGCWDALVEAMRATFCMRR